MYIDPEDKKAWAEEMKEYHQNRKQQVEFRKPKIFTQKEMKLKQTEFNPVLQIYQNNERDLQKQQLDLSKTQQMTQKKFEMVKRYLHEYDLITLDPVTGIERPDEREKTKQCLLPPNFNDYNIITNEKFNDEYFKNMKVIVPRKTYQKPTVNRNKRDYNILTNKYLEDNDNKQVNDKQKATDQLTTLAQKVRNYDFIQGQYYDPQREEEYQKKLKEDQFNHGKNFNDRLPPAWKFRESVYLDQTKEVPEEIKMIDEINKNHKKRFQIRHVLEHEYKERDLLEQERAQDRLLKRHKYDDMIKKYDKEFDILTLEKPQIDHIVKALPPRPPQTSWEKVQLTKSVPNNYNELLPIKEVSIPEGVDIKGNSGLLPSFKPSSAPKSDAAKSHKSQKSQKSQQSQPKSQISQQKSQGQEIKSGGFYLQQQ